MKLTVGSSRDRKKFDLNVPGMSPASFTISFDEETQTIEDIKFGPGRPSLRNADKEKIKTQKLVKEFIHKIKEPQEARHIKAVNWIKKHIRKKYETYRPEDVCYSVNNTLVDTNKFEANCRLAAEQIAEFFIGLCRSMKNIKVGDRKPNRVAGALIGYLDPLIKKGRKNFPADGVILDLQKDKINGFLINELGNRLTIKSYDELIDWYFNASYDDPDAHIDDQNYKQHEQDFYEDYQEYISDEKTEISQENTASLATSANFSATNSITSSIPPTSTTSVTDQRFTHSNTTNNIKKPYSIFTQSTHKIPSSSHAKDKKESAKINQRQASVTSSPSMDAIRKRHSTSAPSSQTIYKNPSLQSRYKHNQDITQFLVDAGDGLFETIPKNFSNTLNNKFSS